MTAAKLSGALNFALSETVTRSIISAIIGKNSEHTQAHL